MTPAPDSAPTLARLTLATTQTEAMAAFYSGVFGADLQPVAAYGTTLYRGALAGVALVLCPNSVAGVQAEQSRHQLTLSVPVLAPVLERVLAHGGRLLSPASPAGTTIADPDGNTLELVQAGSGGA